MQTKNPHNKSSSFQGVLVNPKKIAADKNNETSTSPSISSKASSNKSPNRQRNGFKSTFKSRGLNTTQSRSKSPFTPEKLVVCTNCLKFMQNEVTLIDDLSILNLSIQSLITSYQQ